MDQRKAREMFNLSLDALTNSYQTNSEFLLKSLVKTLLNQGDSLHARENFFATTSSAELSKLLSLLESENSRIRKLALLTITLALTNFQAKLKFLELTELTPIFGRVTLSPLCRLFKDADFQNFLPVLMEMDRNEPLQSSFFWFVSLSSLSHTFRRENFSIIHFKESDLVMSEDFQPSLDYLPDPLFSLIGVSIPRQTYVLSSTVHPIKIPLYSSLLSTSRKTSPSTVDRIDPSTPYLSNNKSIIEEQHSSNLIRSLVTSTKPKATLGNFGLEKIRVSVCSGSRSPVKKYTEGEVKATQTIGRGFKNKKGEETGKELKTLGRVSFVMDSSGRVKAAKRDKSSNRP